MGGSSKVYHIRKNPSTLFSQELLYQRTPKIPTSKKRYSGIRTWVCSVGPFVGDFLDLYVVLWIFEIFKVVSGGPPTHHSGVTIGSSGTNTNN